MPWKASSVMEERLRFVARLLEGEAMTEICREFGISRKTGYKIFDRYREHGLEALSDRSRRPVGGGCRFDNSGGANGAFAIEVHQSIIDINGSTSFGQFTGGTHIFADHNSSVNLNQGYTISGNVANHITLGPSSTLIQSGNLTITYSGTPTITTLYNLSGAGATVSLAANVNYSGAVSITNTCLVAGPSAVVLNANFCTSNCPSGVSHGGQVF